MTPEDAFTKEMVERFEKASPETPFKIENTLTVRANAGTPQEAVISLERVFNYCKSASTSDCAAEKQHFADVTREAIAGPGPPSKERLRLALRHKKWVDGSHAAGYSTAGREMLARPIAQDIYEVVVSENRNTMQVVDERDLARLEITADDAFAIARRNILNMLPSLPNLEQLERSAVVYDGQENVVSLMASDGWDQLAAKLDSRIVVAAPSTHTLVVMREKGADLIKLAESIRQAYEEAERPVSPHIYARSRGRWVQING